MEKQELDKKPVTAVNATYANAAYFKEIMKALNVFEDEVTFTVDQDGLSCRFMDPSHIMMVKLQLPKEGFDFYTVNAPGDFALNLENVVKKVFKNVSKRDQIQVGIQGEEAVFSLLSDFKRTFKTSLLEPDLEELPVPKISFRARAKIVLKCLDRVLKDAENVSNNIIVKLDQDLAFEAEGDENKYHVAIDRNNENILSLENNDRAPQKAMFNIDSLSAFVKAAKPLVDVIELSFNTDMPLMIYADLVGLGTLTFYLAPRIDYA